MSLRIEYLILLICLMASGISFSLNDYLMRLTLAPAPRIFCQELFI